MSESANKDAEWWEDLYPAINVQRISLEWVNWNCGELWSALSVLDAASDVLFPALETVAIHTEDVTTSPETRTDFASAAATLIDMLHTRKDRQVPLRNLFVDEKIKHWSFWSLVAEITPITFFTPESNGASPPVRRRGESTVRPL